MVSSALNCVIDYLGALGARFYLTNRTPTVGKIANQAGHHSSLGFFAARSAVNRFAQCCVAVMETSSNV